MFLQSVFEKVFSAANFFTFVVLGFFSIIAQVVIIRELSICFYGNEFFIGVILAIWLAWTAFGSWIGHKISTRLKNSFSFLVFIYLFAVFCFAFNIFFVRGLKSFLGLPGEIPNVIVSIFWTIFILAPLGLVLGLWWTLTTQFFLLKFKNQDEVHFLNRCYFFEILGFVFGGILFSFFLVKLQEFFIVNILLLLILGLLIFLSAKFEKKNYKFFFILLFVFFFFLNFTEIFHKINKVTTALRYPGQELQESVKTLFGVIDVTKISNQNNFYENGLILGANQKTQFEENLVHLALLEHFYPEKVLLIGGGFTGVLGEILKHPVKEVYYLEPDPELIKITEKYLNPDLKRALKDSRVKIFNTCGYYFLKNTSQKFNVIFLNLPPPATALINRFYTKEFFKIAFEKLDKSGILVTSLPFSESVPSQNLKNLNALIYKTLRSVFPQIIILPEEEIFFIASKDGFLTYDGEVLLKRFKERNIQTDFLSASYLKWRVSSERIKKTLGFFAKNKNNQINTIFWPVAYFYQNLFWLEHFYPAWVKLFGQIKFLKILVFSGVFLFFGVVLFLGRKKTTNVFPIFSMMVGGFSLMAWETLIIFIYQVTIGYLYFRLALLITGLMIGMAVGVRFGDKISRNFRPSFLYLSHLIFAVYCFVLILVTMLIFKISNVYFSEITLLAFAFLNGFLGALIFPFASRIYFSKVGEPSEKTGIIYSADLTGSLLGAFLPMIILIPVFGVFQTLGIIALINFFMFLVLFLAKNLGSKNI